LIFYLLKGDLPGDLLIEGGLEVRKPGLDLKAGTFVKGDLEREVPLKREGGLNLGVLNLGVKGARGFILKLVFLIVKALLFAGLNLD